MDLLILEDPMRTDVGDKALDLSKEMLGAFWGDPERSDEPGRVRRRERSLEDAMKFLFRPGKMHVDGPVCRKCVLRGGS
jgi:hypothetical protein